MILIDHEFLHPLPAVEKGLSSHKVVEQSYVYLKDEHCSCKSASRPFMYISIDR
jgi:hypothetical protein